VKISIFKFCRENKVIPNVTINGEDLTDEKANCLSELCGAVAVSLYDYDTCYNAVKKLTDLGMKQINIHCLVAKETEEKSVNVSANPLPVSFKDFVKHPKEAIAFLAIIAMGYLYVDIRSTFQTNADKQDRRVDKVETRLDAVQDALRKSDSSGAVTASQLKMLNDLGAIKSLK
jgi:hypothetical protein